MNTQKGPFFPCFAGDQMREYGPIKLQHKRVEKQLFIRRENQLQMQEKYRSEFKI